MKIIDTKYLFSIDEIKTIYDLLHFIYGEYKLNNDEIKLYEKCKNILDKAEK